MASLRFLNGLSQAALPEPAAPPFTMRRGPLLMLSDLLTFACYHARLSGLAMVGFIVVCVAAGWPSWSGFEADSLLVIAATAPQTPNQDVALPSRELATTAAEISLLHSPIIMSRVVRDVGASTLFPELAAPRMLGFWPPLAEREQGSRAAIALASQVRAEQLPSSPIIRVSFLHANRDVAVLTIAAVVNAYVELRRSRYSAIDGKPLAQALDETVIHLNAIDDRVRQAQLDYQIYDVAKDKRVAFEDLDRILSLDEQFRMRRQQIATELASLGTQLTAMPARIFDAEEAATPSTETARTALLSLKLLREHMLAQYSPEYSGMQELDRKIAAAEKSVQEPAKASAITTRYVRNPAVDALQTRIAALQVELPRIDQQLRDLSFRFEIAISRIASVWDADRTLTALRVEKAHLVEAQRQMSLREGQARVLDAVEQADAADGHVARGPEVAAVPPAVWPDYLFWVGLIVLLASIVPLMIVIRLRKVYLVPREVERDLGVPLLAEFGRNDPGLHTLESQRQIEMLSDLLLAIRFAGRPLFAVQALSIEPQSAAYAIVQALAQQLRERYGLRIAVVDSRCPGHPFSICFEGAVDRRIATNQQYSLPLWHDDGAEDPYDFLDALRCHYDILLITRRVDGRMHSNEAAATFIDTNLLVLRAAHTPSGVARQVRDDVIQNGGNILGAIFTDRQDLGLHIRRR